MSSLPTSSVFPERFKTGIEHLEGVPQVDLGLLSLFGALEHFQYDIRQHSEVDTILRVTQLYLRGLHLFEATGFQLLNPTDFGFDLVQWDPPSARGRLEGLVQAQMENGRFSWALTRNRMASFPTANEPGDRGVLVPLTASNHTVGMFCGVLQGEPMACREITFRMLAILLGTTAYALDRARLADDLENRVLAAHRDLQSSLKEKRELARIPAESPAPILRIRRNGQLLYFNDAARPLVMAGAIEAGDFVRDEWLGRVAEAFRQAGSFVFETDCGDQSFSFVARALAELDYVNFYGTDITARKRAEAELRLAQDALKHQNRQLVELNLEKNEMLGIAAHDLRNPLTQIVGSADLLLIDPQMDPREVQEFLTIIKNGAGHMIHLVKNLLDVSAIESGQLKWSPTAVAVESAVAQIAARHAASAAQKEQKFRFSLPRDPHVIWMDRHALTEVLDNLISNAVKYSPRGKNIFISLGGPDGQVRFEVRDEGPGLSAEDQKRLFGKFARLSARPTAGESSTGLGLSIVKRMVEGAGGRVWCESVLGTGASFIVEWPRLNAVPTPSGSA